MSSIRLTKLRDLNVQAGTGERHDFLSAASGLVHVGSCLYVVADDELQLGIFELGNSTPGYLMRVLPGELSDQPKKRKKQKPDLEVLIHLPPFAGHAHGALLALGSGSSKRRDRGVLLALDHRGRVRQASRVIDASALFAELQNYFAELNLEGGWVHGSELRLLQRGNKGDATNAVIQLDLLKLLAGLSNSDVLPAIAPSAIHPMQLGEIAGVPLCFTDACGLSDGRWVFSAVAEDTDNAYDDGACVGAAIGMADAQHRLLWIKRVAPAYKIEGIEVRQQPDGLQMLLVTDADNSEVPASLLAAQLQSRQ